MRATLRWGLYATIILSAGAILWPRKATPIVLAASRLNGNAPARPAPSPTAPGPSAAPLPQDLEAISVSPAMRDPFVLPVASPPPVPAPAAVPAPTVPSPPTPPPVVAAPAFKLRFLGSLVTPEGKRLVLLTRGDTAVQVEAGVSLEDGYVVRQVDDSLIRVVHATFGTVVEIPIPEVAPPNR